MDLRDLDSTKTISRRYLTRSKDYDDDDDDGNPSRVPPPSKGCYVNDPNARGGKKGLQAAKTNRYEPAPQRRRAS